MSAYDALTPELMLDAVEERGYRCDGRLLALNSFENRVYQLWLEDDTSLVAKFYRPGRWPNAAIHEEHAFALELAAREIPVVAPLAVGGKTLGEHGGYRFALYPRRPGRTPTSAPSPHHPRAARTRSRPSSGASSSGSSRPSRPVRSSATRRAAAGREARRHAATRGPRRTVAARRRRRRRGRAGRAAARSGPQG